MFHSLGTDAWRGMVGVGAGGVVGYPWSGLAPVALLAWGLVVCRHSLQTSAVSCATCFSSWVIQLALAFCELVKAASMWLRQESIWFIMLVLGWSKSTGRKVSWGKVVLGHLHRAWELVGSMVC
jgi:hypothetical protein